MPSSEDFADLVRAFLENGPFNESDVARCMAERLGNFHRSNLTRWKEGVTRKPRREAIEAFADCLRLNRDDRNRLLRAAGYPVESETGLRPLSVSQLDDYHRLVFKDYANIELIGLYREQREPVTLPLDQVFVSLKLIGGEREEEKHGGPGLGRPEPEPKAFGQALVETEQARKHLVIVGGAGSGKTTFLRYAARALAEAHIQRNRALAEAHIGLSGYIPLFLRLRDVFPALVTSDGDSRRDVDCDGLIRAMAKTFRQDHPDSRLDDAFFEALVRSRQHRCLILLDGLDEVVTPPNVDTEPTIRREAMADAIRTLARADWNNRLVVTSRPDAYRGQAVLGEPFLRWDVQAVTPEQRRELVEKWCGAVYGEAAENRLESLLHGLDALAQRDARLVETPLLITLVALVWREKERLPYRRWKIFQAGLETLLDLSKSGPGGRDLQAAQQRMETHLPRIAFGMLRQGNQPVVKEQILAWLLEG